MPVITLVRHGQASFGADDYDVLSSTGHEQARVLGAWLAAQGPETTPGVVLHGGLRRHRETWEGIAEGAGWTATAHVDPDWDEFDFHAVLAHHGALTGARLAPDADRRAFQAHFEQGTGHWIAHDPDATGEAPYPEPFAGFVTRARRALESARAQGTPSTDSTGTASPGPAGPTLVVTSGGVIATLAAALLAPDPDEPVALGVLWDRLNTVVVNTSVTRILIGQQGARLLTFNEHPHLPRELLTYR